MNAPEQNPDHRSSLPDFGSDRPAAAPSPVVAIVAVAGVLVVAWLLARAFGESVGLHFGKPGTLNFVQYWSAFRLLESGANPYDGTTMHTFQAALGQLETRTNMMWNPPWTAALLSPLGLLPFPSAALLWAFCSILMLCGIALLGPDALGRQRPSPLVCALVTMGFYPVLECLVWGQISILLAFWFMLFLYFERKGRLTAAGLALVPVTIKPHLFFLMAVPALRWLIALPAKQRISFLAGAGGGLAAVIAATMLRWPGVLGWWLASLSTTPTGPGVVPLEVWKTATVATYVRAWLSSGGHVPQWPMWAIPLAAFVSTSGYFLVSRREIRWSEIAPPLLCLSLGLGSYGWLYDQSVLLVCEIAMVCDALVCEDRARRRGLLGVLLLIQLLAVWVGSRPGSAQADFVWLPWAILAAWIGSASLRVTGSSATGG